MTYPFRRHPTLRPGDVPIALQLALVPGLQYEFLAQCVRTSVSQAHDAVKRLELAKLAHARTRTVDGERLENFLYHGVPHAFPPILGGPATGVPLAVPPLRGRSSLPPADSIVWPCDDGPAEGMALMPLYRGAVRLGRTNRRLHELLVAVDLVRLGRASRHDPDVRLVIGYGLSKAS